jgi:hypothetical protein
MPFIYHSSTFHEYHVAELSAFQADKKWATGSVILDLELLKPCRVSAVAEGTIERTAPADRVWLEYAYRKHHPVLQYLPTKLAEWIGENMQDELGFPDKSDPNKWSVSELNDLLKTHVVCNKNGCSLETFGCLEWESELYRGIMRARCYPFNMRGHRFHRMNPQVHNQRLSLVYDKHILISKKLYQAYP